MRHRIMKAQTRVGYDSNTNFQNQQFDKNHHFYANEPAAVTSWLKMIEHITYRDTLK